MPALLVVLAACLLLAPAAAGAAAERKAAKGDDGGRAKRQQILKQEVLDHFVFGVCSTVEWHTEVRQVDGARFDFSNDYLSAGVGHGDPWFFKYSPFLFNRGEEAKRLGMGRWFTWYMLSQSKSPEGLTYEGTGPAKTAPANAKHAAVMREYFEWFKKSLIECAKHPDVPTVMQIEPDEWCHLLLAGGMDPTKCEVKVGSCGMPELAGLPDNVNGWAKAFARLRDQYAPNVLLACNPSGWDHGGSMSGANMGRIFKGMCGDDYELATFETGDRDKGGAGSGKLPPYKDEVAVTGSFPNHLKWISEYHAASGQWVVVWQAAMGNTYFATCDNSPGHRTDNIAQYLLEGYPKNDAIARYVAAGCCGFMFNGGQGDSTSVFDAKKDGITNPKPLPGTQGKISKHADDDGGFMRVFGAAYYKKPYPILGKKGKRGAAEGADDEEVAEKPKPKPVETPKLEEAAIAPWREKLRKRLVEELAIRRHPRFVSARLRATLSVEAVADRTITVDMDGSRLELPWASLAADEYAQLAEAQARENKPDDDALAGFFLILAGRANDAETRLGRAGNAADAVRAAFPKPPPVVATPAAPAPPAAPATP